MKIKRLKINRVIISGYDSEYTKALQYCEMRKMKVVKYERGVIKRKYDPSTKDSYDYLDNEKFNMIAEKEIKNNKK